MQSFVHRLISCGKTNQTVWISYSFNCSMLSWRTCRFYLIGGCRKRGNTASAAEKRSRGIVARINGHSNVGFDDQWLSVSGLVLYPVTKRIPMNCIVFIQFIIYRTERNDHWKAREVKCMHFCISVLPGGRKIDHRFPRTSGHVHFSRIAFEQFLSYIMMFFKEILQLYKYFENFMLIFFPNI